MICEICGGKAPKLRKVIVEGSVMNVCPDCFATLTKKTPVESRLSGSPAKTLVKREETAKPHAGKTIERKSSGGNVSLAESVELVSNYRELIRSRRREFGWSEEDLGDKTGLKASLIKKMESGKITPSIVDARKIENALKMKLLRASASQEEANTRHLVKKTSSSVTLGDILRDEVSERQ